MTVNHVSPRDYDWTTFHEEICWSIDTLRASYADSPRFAAESLAFRYINSSPFDEDAQDVYGYLRDKLHVEFLPPIDVLPQGVDARARNLQTQTSFMCREPVGRLTLAFANAYAVDDRGPASRLLWQIMFDVREEDVPDSLEGVHQWLEAAHGVIDTVFRNMIRGELEESFT